MSTDRPESSFRERRSAYVGEEASTTEAEPATSTPAPPAERPAAAAPPADARPEARVEAEAGAGTEAAQEMAELDEMAALELPDPAFHEIVYEYAIRAQQFLGDAPITRDGQRRVLPAYAKHMIDLLGILEERTRGNLTPEESQLLGQVLADLRLRYVGVTS
jgi:hypothetical protein